MTEQKRSTTPLMPALGQIGALKIVPVPPGHEHEPDELCANVDLLSGVVYVREEDWPLIKAELANLPTRQ
jgi:hypothetical protein